MRSEASTVAAYLESLHGDRRTAIETVRAVILEHLPPGYEEAMDWGMITYRVPLSACPSTYNGKPLVYAGLASQKQAMSLYLLGAYARDDVRARLEAAYAASGKRMDLGKSCVRFRSPDDLPLDAVGEAIASISVPAFIALHEPGGSLRSSRRRRQE